MKKQVAANKKKDDEMEIKWWKKKALVAVAGKQKCKLILIKSCLYATRTIWINILSRL